MSLTGCGGGSSSVTSGLTGGSGGSGGGGGGGSVATSIDLEWVAPSTNSDGSPVVDLQGFKVYYGTNSGDYVNSIDVGNSTSCVVSSLSQGTVYYFVVVAYDSAGTESNPSNEVSKTL